MEARARSGASEAGARLPRGKRLRLWLPVVLMMGLQVALSSQSRLPEALPAIPGADKVLHAGWFFLLGLAAWRAGRRGEGWSASRTAAMILGGAVLWGVGDEWHQSFVPGRAVEAADLVADVAGSALAVVTAPLVGIARRLLACRCS